MALQIIDIGSAPNDSTGDDARTWAQKTNANNAYLESLITAYSSTVTVAGVEVNLLKAPGNTVKRVVELGDRIVIFADETTILTLLYTNALADGDKNNIGVTPDWNTGNYQLLKKQGTI